MIRQLGCLLLLVVCFVLLTPLRPALANGSGSQSEGWREVLKRWQVRLHKEAARLVEQGKWYRKQDGYLYTVDLALLMDYASQVGAKKMYLQVRNHLHKHAILNKRSDPYTKGFVAWRVHRTRALDASGTTEALRVARALWRGATRFKRPQDRKLALLVLDGYRRHQYVEHGMWIIRNYFNFKTRSFSPNSYLIDYDPDFVKQVAKATNKAKWKTLAAKSSKLVKRAQSASGLFYSTIQPELRTLLPKSLTIFSPNDVVKIQNSLSVAELLVDHFPSHAKGTLQVVSKQLPVLHAYALGRTGQPIMKQYRAGAVVYACLVRLAHKLKEHKLIETLGPLLVKKLQSTTKSQRKPRLFVLGQLLLTMKVLRLGPKP